jgi:5-methylthioadenosine/S-adenosylhomocysteine deaminase
MTAAAISLGLASESGANFVARTTLARRRPERRAGLALRLVFVACLALSMICVAASRLAAQPSSQQVDLMVDGGTAVTMDAERHVVADAAIAIRGDSIVAVGPRSEMLARFSPAQSLDARGKLILPGLINGHNHAAMTLLRGLGDDKPLQEWLNDYIFPAEARNVDKDFVTIGARLAALEMILSGTTTFVDMYYFEDAVAEVTRQAGMRGVLGEAIINFPAPDNKSPAEALAYAEAFLRRWQGDPLIRAAVAPHSTYLLSEEPLRAAFALARNYHAPILIHLSENQREVDDSRAEHGLSPVGYLDRLGLLGPDVTAAHCVAVDAADIALLTAHDVGCVINTSSNMMLASGVAPVPDMRAAGMRLGLGTDGPAGSNNDLNIMEEMDLTAKLQKVSRRDPRALNAEAALEMATIGGARALHMESEIGSLEPGKKADLIVLGLDAPNAVPLYDLYAQIVYSLKADDVETVVIGGRIVMRDREVMTIDQAQTVAEARQYAAKVEQSLRREGGDPPRK